ncbi:DNA-directed RNA polymerase, mitochondrial [Osmia bicornis bicornis]|uniref:DNA-directed RNA polymerase, mitochondrial n=1 Tax=Osmia bicornis bicornis TaxID=1437191 RepID=UPI001EAECE98|nr:DNA-directed RNA polymerase, mitochondrial [Osmia bicornis bicornis]
MYKLFVTRVTKRISPHDVVPKQIIVQRSMRLCSFCNFYHGKMTRYMKYYQIRTSSTTVNVLGHSLIKKKVKRRTKKYTELLAVTDEVASTKMTKVHKLMASDLSMFVHQPDVITNNTYDLRDPSINTVSDSKSKTKDCHTSYDNESYFNIQEENHIDTLFAEEEMKYYNKEISENFKISHSSVENDTLYDTSIKNPEIINEKLNKILQSKVNRTLPQKQEFFKNNSKHTLPYIESLLVHMQVYLSCGLLNRTHNTLMKYRKYVKNRVKHCDECVELYNIVLEAYASRRKVTKVLELYEILKKDLLIPTSQTYVYVFDVLGGDVITDKQKALLTKLSSEMTNYNITFNDLFNKSYFTNNQRENVLKSIRVLIPNFEPSYDLPSTEYACGLLSKTLTKNNYRSPVEGLLTIEELKGYLKEQVQDETAIEVQIKSVESSRNTNTLHSKEKLNEMENYWRDAASKAFERNLKCLKEEECQSYNALMVLHPFLEVLDKEDYVNAILREVRQVTRGSEAYSTSLKMLYIDLGRYIYNKYEIQTKKQSGLMDKMLSIYLKYLDWYMHPENMTHLNNANNRIVWQYLEHEEIKHGISLSTRCLNWPMDVIINVGKFLYNIILNDLILQPNILKGHDLKCSIPAFYTLFRNKGTYLSEQIKSHPLASKLYKESDFETLTFNSHILPSYAPPRPWTSIHNGGYLITKTDFMRVSYTNAPWRKLQSTPTKQLYPVFDSLNQLGSIPWKINTNILDVVIKIFQDGGSEKLNIPQPVSVLPLPPSVNKDSTSEEKRNAAIAMAHYKQKKYDMYSLWCDTLYKLSIANHLRNKVFWLPHNMDFRGRVYPVPPHLHHLTSDVGRSLLLFAKGKPLGPNGLEWLKLHVINLTNLKKGSSVKERIEYANENMESILDSATKPLTGNMWWAESEEPWQTLAGCMEIANALKAPNIEKYVSRFPVHQDGSCNGLQHYAALGRDEIGAKSVNLHPFDIPKDVYTSVADIIEKQRRIDADNNVQIAKILEGFVKRKVIKQTVMTTVYGVTKYGAKHQIARQLRDIKDFPHEYVWPASIYLAENTFHSLRTMFKSAREIQDWFINCARIISSVCGENVEWITPLGLPIVQPYIKQQKLHKTHIKGNGKPDSLKQKNAFAPNFIHSLDSSHMMLTSLHCNQEDVTFVSVHDCFWTHPCTVNIMNKICREQFVALHCEPILENLADYFVQYYAPIYEKLGAENKVNVPKIRKCLTSVPSKGNFDINNVLSSVYFFN